MNINKAIVLFLIIGVSFNSASFAMIDYNDIYEAARRGRLDRVRELLQGDIDVNGLDDHQNSFLHYAAELGRTDIV